MQSPCCTLRARKASSLASTLTLIPGRIGYLVNVSFVTECLRLFGEDFFFCIFYLSSCKDFLYFSSCKDFQEALSPLRAILPISTFPITIKCTTPDTDGSFRCFCHLACTLHFFFSFVELCGVGILSNEHTASVCCLRKKGGWDGCLGSLSCSVIKTRKMSFH